MGRICREVQEWVEEEVERPIEEWEERQEERCREEPCKWWMLCLNKLVCWLVVVTVKVVRWVVVTVGKWVTRVVCEVVNFVVDLIGAVIALILSIPVLGGLIRTIWNWVTEIIWRAVGSIDFIGSLLGIRPRKKMYIGVLIPRESGRPIVSEADFLPQIEATRDLFDRLCNINVIYTGACSPDMDAPDAVLRPSCNAAGFFADWWTGGSWIEFATLRCRFIDTARRIIGHGSELMVIPVIDIDGFNGCSMGPTHNYVVTVANGARPFTTAHEVGHACMLLHRDGTQNLMSTPSPMRDPALTNWQIAVIRGSRHCIYI